MKITLTDNKNEMILQGKELFKRHEELYTESMVKIIDDSLLLHFPQATKLERENLFFESIYNYWVFGCSVDEFYYLGFYDKNANEKNEYITRRRHNELIKKTNNPDKRHICDNKYETYELLSDYYLRDMISIENLSDYEIFKSFISKHKSFVVKPSNLYCGIGVYKVDVTNDTDPLKLFNDILSRNNDNNYLKKSNVVIEEIIVQDEALSKLHPQSINGIRVTTVRRGNDVKLLHPWIKIGMNGTFVASAVLGGMDAGIDERTGMIITHGFGELGNEYAEHPDSHISLIGYQIPKWDELVKLSKKLAVQLPDGLNYIGWDFVLTPKGWCVMEANYSGDSMWQLFLKKGTLKEFTEILGNELDRINSVDL